MTNDPRIVETCGNGSIVDNTVQDSITTVIDITNIILDLFNVPIVGPVLSIVNRLINRLWPSNYGTAIWEALMAEVEKIVDKKIDEAVKSKALSELEGLQRIYSSYQSDLERWLGDRDNPEYQEIIRQQFNVVNNFFAYQMPSFAVSGFEILLLSVYTQAANLHLNLLRDITVHGTGWGYSEGTVERYNQLQRCLITAYVDYCVDQYNLELEKLPKETLKNWVDYNRYRREMTLSVLDIVSLFPNYDASVYDLPINAELSRQVYTDPLGSYLPYNTANPISWYDMKSYIHPNFWQIDKYFIKPPNLFTFAEKLIMYSGYRTDVDPIFYYYWSGSKLESRRVHGNEIITTISGDISQSITLVNVDFKDSDIYKITTNYIGQYTGSLLGTNPITFSLTNSNGQTERKYEYSKLLMPGKEKIYYSQDEIPPNIETGEPDYVAYSHRLSYVSAFNPNFTSGKKIGTVPIYGWTHTSVSRDNLIYPDKITQIPIVKSYEIGEYYKVMQGPGFTGGDILTKTYPVQNPSGSTLAARIRVSTAGIHLNQRYTLRMHYAASGSVYDAMIIKPGQSEGGYHMRLNPTMENGETLTFNSFTSIGMNSQVLTSSQTDLTLYIKSMSPSTPGTIYIDRIEFIPVDNNYEAEQNLEKAQKAVNALFTAGRNALQTDVTDYKVDQVSIVVDCVSKEVYPNEKRELQNLVKYAKRLTNSRNLLVDPNFTSINSEGVNGWYGSNGIVIGHGDDVFKGNYIQLAGTNDAQYPTYLYQKIDESKLKEYTRYKLRGFIKSSQDLEAYVIRYDAKHETLDVSNNLFPDISPVNACGEPNRCGALQYLDENPRLECSSIQDGILSDSHSFSLNIDTGSIDFNENVGIWVLFKISTPEGYARFGNLEVIEDDTVIGEALARVKRQETKWRNKLTQLRTETQAIYTRAKQAIDNLFTNAQDSHLKIGATFASIVAARKIVQSIREAYMPWLSIVPGVNYPIFTELNERVQRAFQLYDVRNVVRNGRFLSGVSDWIVTSDVKVQEENGNNVLVLSNWDAQVLQCLKLYQD
ncbi:hypothetical protein ABE03_01635, partial [Bacillus thuringiensis]|nr:hypothetical protein [Bacillus thuringiensis]